MAVKTIVTIKMRAWATPATRPRPDVSISWESGIPADPLTVDLRRLVGFVNQGGGRPVVESSENRRQRVTMTSTGELYQPTCCIVYAAPR